MHSYFTLSTSPQPIDIEFFLGLPSFNQGEMKIQLPYNANDFVPDKCLNSLTHISHDCTHEIGHYLHSSVNREFCGIKIKPYYQIKSKRDRDIYLLRECVAELSALAFFDISGRPLSSEVISHKQHSLMNTLYDFYCEKGRDYCINMINSLAILRLSETNYKDIIDIGRKGWMGRPKIK